MSEPTSRTEIHKESSDRPDALGLIRWPGLHLTVSLAQGVDEGRGWGAGGMGGAGGGFFDAWEVASKANLGGFGSRVEGDG